MRRIAMAIMLCLLALPGPASTAEAERLQHLPDLPASSMPAPADVLALPDTAFKPVGKVHRLAGDANGRGWWRLQPGPASGTEPLLLVYHSYSARVTVMAPPDYRPVTRSLFDRSLDPRFSRRALVFPLPAARPGLPRRRRRALSPAGSGCAMPNPNLPKDFRPPPPEFQSVFSGG